MCARTSSGTRPASVGTFAARRNRTPLKLSSFEIVNGVRSEMRLKVFGPLADFGGPAGPETVSIFFSAREDVVLGT